MNQQTPPRATQEQTEKPTEEQHSELVRKLSQGYDSIPDVITMPHYFYPLVTEFLGDVNGMDVVDFGCGNGYLLRKIRAANPSARLMGVDFSPVLLSGARSRTPDAQFVTADLNVGLPMATGSQDRVVITEVIEHLLQPQSLLQEAHRVLRKHGTCTLTFPNVDGWPFYRLFGESLTEVAQKLPWLMLFVPGEHPARTRQPIDAMLHYDAVLDMVTAAGFVVEEAAGYEVLPDVAMIKGIRHVDYFHPQHRIHLSRFVTDIWGARFCYRVFLRCRATT